MLLSGRSAPRSPGPEKNRGCLHPRNYTKEHFQTQQRFQSITTPYSNCYEMKWKFLGREAKSETVRNAASNTLTLNKQEEEPKH